jgi:hypothetical protein
MVGRLNIYSTYGVLESRILRGIFEPERKTVTPGWLKFYSEGSRICTHHHHHHHLRCFVRWVDPSSVTSGSGFQSILFL